MVGQADSAVVLRLAGPADAARVLAADVFDGPAQAAFTARFLGVGAPDPRCLLLLAEHQGTVVGFASGLVLDHPDKPSMLFINELGVNEGFRRQGIGHALLLAIRAEGQARGCRESFVLTEGDNLAARALYRSAGGEETGDIVMYEWKEDG